MYLILEKHHHSAAVNLLPTQETKPDSQAPCFCLYLVCCQSLYVKWPTWFVPNAVCRFWVLMLNWGMEKRVGLFFHLAKKSFMRLEWIKNWSNKNTSRKHELLTCVSAKFCWNAYLQKRHSVIKRNSRLPLLTSIPKIEKIQDVGDPGGSWHGERALCQKSPSYWAGHSCENQNKSSLGMKWWERKRELATQLWLVSKWSTTRCGSLKWNSPALG